MAVDRRRLTSQDLVECRSFISKLVDLINERRDKLVGETNLKNFSLQLGDKATDLNGLVTQLTNAKFREILTDLQEPIKNIKTVTDKVEFAIKELDDMNKVIRMLTNIVDIFSIIVAGKPIAAIAKLVDGINQL